MRRRHFVSLAGGAMALPLAAPAEPIGNKYRLAFLDTASRRDFRPIKEFFDELSRSGCVEGQNLFVEFFSTEGKSERRSEIARDAVRGNPNAFHRKKCYLEQLFRSSSGYRRAIMHMLRRSAVPLNKPGKPAATL
jgi:hypothetical protein